MCDAQPTDDAIRAAVEAAETYQAAAIALDMQYPKLYAAARRLGVMPKSVAAKRQRRALPPPVQLPPITRFEARGSALHGPRKPAPEPTPPVLGPWLPPGNVPTKPGVVLVRLDQAGRVRAEIDDLSGDGWCGWVIRDVTGAVVGKIGITSGMCGGMPSSAEARRKAAAGADEALVALGWLPAGYMAPAELCAQDSPVCSLPRPAAPVDPIVALAERLLGARRAERADLGTELARLVMNRAAEPAA